MYEKTGLEGLEAKVRMEKREFIKLERTQRCTRRGACRADDRTQMRGHHLGRVDLLTESESRTWQLSNGLMMSASLDPAEDHQGDIATGAPTLATPRDTDNNTHLHGT